MSTPTEPQDPYGSQPSGSGPTPPPPYGAQPGYGAQPPAYGSQPPAYGSQPPSYGGGMPPAGMPPTGYGYGGGTEKNNLGTWALVLGILSIVCCGFFAGIPAIILGNKSKQAAAAGQANNGNLGNIGMILGWIGIAFGVIGFLFWAANGFSYDYNFSSY